MYERHGMTVRRFLIVHQALYLTAANAILYDLDEFRGVQSRLGKSWDSLFGDRL